MTAVTIRYQANRGGLANLLTSPAGLVGRDMLRRGYRVEAAAKRACPVDTGRLRSSIATSQILRPEGPGAEVSTNVKYAIYVHQGTGIYGPRGTPIRPVNGVYLIFTPRGASRPVFARQVSGMRGRPFLLDGLAEAVRD